jgi:hypothetical protein
MCIKRAAGGAGLPGPVPVLACLFNNELIITVSSQIIKNIGVKFKFVFLGTFMYNLFRFCFNTISVVGSSEYLKLQYCNYILFTIIIN